MFPDRLQHKLMELARRVLFVDPGSGRTIGMQTLEVGADEAFAFQTIRTLRPMVLAGHSLVGIGRPAAS